MGLLRAKGQVGCPPGIFTDAQLGFCLGAVKVADRYWFVSKALAQAPIPARRMNWPSGPKWDIAHVVHKQRTSQYCFGTRWKHSPMAKHIGCRCGVDRDRGRHDGLQRVPAPIRRAISHIIRVEQHQLPVGPPPNSSMIRGIPCMPSRRANCHPPMTKCPQSPRLRPLTRRDFHLTTICRTLVENRTAQMLQPLRLHQPQQTRGPRD